jgi:hypothetical protein
MRGLSIVLCTYILFFVRKVRFTGAVSDYQLEEIKECVRSKQVEKNYKRVPHDDVFELDFGDPAIEVFHVLSVHAMKSIEFLENCVRDLEPNFFHDRGGERWRNNTHGGANITYLTGTFQEVLPDIYGRILQEADKVMQSCAAGVRRTRGSSHWDVPLNTLGVRSVQYTSFEYKQRAMTAAEKALHRQRLREQRERDGGVILGGYPMASEDELDEDGELTEPIEIIPYEYDPYADEHLGEYLHADHRGRYTLLINLSDRAHFHGGEVIVRKKKVERQAHSNGDGNRLGEERGEKEEEIGGLSREGGETQREYGDDGYDEEEDMDVGEVVGIERITVPVKGRKRREMEEGPKYHVMYSEVGRYTPERGSVMVLRDDYEHGMQPLVNGRRHGLVIEFWAYADSQVGAKRPRVGLPLSSRWKEL